MRATTLQGFGFDDIFDAVDDVFDEIKDVVGDIVETTVDKLDNAFPYLAAAGGFVVGGPAGLVQGFRLGSQMHSAQEAKEKGEDARKEYARAMAMGNYLASAGIDTSGSNIHANRLIDQLTELDYDYKSDEGQELIEAYIVQERERKANTDKALMIAAAIGGAALLFVLVRRMR